MTRKFRTAVYHKGESRYLARGGSRLVPRRRFTYRGLITNRKPEIHMYEVVFRRPDGKKFMQWMSVSDITNITLSKQKKAVNRDRTEEMKTKVHNPNYSH